MICFSVRGLFGVNFFEVPLMFAPVNSVRLLAAQPRKVSQWRQDMNFSLVIHQSQWRTIFTIPQGTTLQKGRHGVNRDITKAAASISEKFGCYSWGSDSVIFYCGSFAQDYARGNFKTNLQGRVHQYLQNHGRKGAKRRNTNLMVFDNINDILKQSNVLLRLFTFESLHIGDDHIDFVTFSMNPDLVHAVEQLLICTYRRQEQCKWNRT